ncbi:hypothetical protein ACOSQ3_015031 [Xanthoceras sorbifolium]
MSDWSDLSIEILNLITERLYYIDQIRFRMVCKSWRLNIYDDIKYADKLPWIMGYSGKKKIHSSLFYLYEPSQKRRYLLKNKILVGAELRASKFGWLLLSKKLTKSYTCSSSSFFFYSPFTGEIIQLPELHMEDINRATFSTAPASSNCVIFVINLCYRANKFCVSTFSLGDTTWSSHWFNDYHGHGPLIYNVAYAKGVFYCAFHAFDVMGAYNPALREWKLHPYPPVFKRPYQYHLSLIESPDDGNLILLSYNYNDPEWVFRFDQSQMKWFRIENFMSGQSNADHEQVEIENLNNRILFYSLDNGISLPAEGEASKLANTIYSTSFRWYRWCTSRGGKGGTHQSPCPQIYDWVDEGADRLWKVWIQPPQTR